MSTYIFVLVLHVGVAVLGLGSITALALVARVTPLGALASLARAATATLAGMLATGLVLDVLMEGAFHELWWFRLAGLSLLVTGAVLARARRQLQRGQQGALDEVTARTQATQMAWLAAALVGWIVLLMEWKPFA